MQEAEEAHLVDSQVRDGLHSAAPDDRGHGQGVDGDQQDSEKRFGRRIDGNGQSTHQGHANAKGSQAGIVPSRERKGVEITYTNAQKIRQSVFSSFFSLNFFICLVVASIDNLLVFSLLREKMRTGEMEEAKE